jgi:hypothetical protein
VAGKKKERVAAARGQRDDLLYFLDSGFDNRYQVAKELGMHSLLTLSDRSSKRLVMLASMNRYTYP